MKSLKKIRAEIRKNRDSITAKKAEIKKLSFEEEKSALFNVDRMRAFDKDAYKKLSEAAEANAPTVEKLRREIFAQEIETRILYDNARAALINEAYPVIFEACKKYAGKPYGDKTSAAIYEEVKKAGYSFYFSARDSFSIVVIQELKDGYTRPDGIRAAALATDGAGHMTRFIDKENKINVLNVEIKAQSPYTENPAKKARELAKDIKKHEADRARLEEARAKLSAALPEGIKEPDYITSYYVSF